MLCTFLRLTTLTILQEHVTFLCFVDLASPYNLVNKANLVHNFSYCVYFFSLNVSGDYLPIIRRNNCIYATLVLVFHSTLHNRQSSMQNNKYQVSHKYICFSWWWKHSCPKHVEKWNKHTKKKCAPSWLYWQDLSHVFADDKTKHISTGTSVTKSPLTKMFQHSNLLQVNVTLRLSLGTEHVEIQKNVWCSFRS